MSKLTGSGRTETLSDPLRLLLYNFDIDGYQLKVEHRIFLNTAVVPVLRAGGSVSIVGLASRSGSFHHNDRISIRRAESVRTFLQQSVPGGFALRQFNAFGERKAQREGQRDGSEDQRFRSAVLFLSSGPVPPPPRMDNDSLRELPLPQIGGSEGVLDTIGQVLDVTSGAASILNVALDVLLIDVAGTAIGAISTLIALPAVWLESNKFARQNGQKLGFSKAIQEMSDSFDDYDLRSKAEATWPPIPHPAPKFSGPDESETVAERSARAGKREGYESAWLLVTQMEKVPRTFPVNLRGKHIQMKLSGRRFLWLLHQAFKEDVWRQILRKLG